jgi:hypothetical protein
MEVRMEMERWHCINVEMVVCNLRCRSGKRSLKWRKTCAGGDEDEDDEIWSYGREGEDVNLEVEMEI